MCSCAHLWFNRHSDCGSKDGFLKVSFSFFADRYSEATFSPSPSSNRFWFYFDIDFRWRFSSPGNRQRFQWCAAPRRLLRRKEIHAARLFSTQIFVLDVRSVVGGWFQGVQVNRTQMTVVTPTAPIDIHSKNIITISLLTYAVEICLPILI